MKTLAPVFYNSIAEEAHRQVVLSEIGGYEEFNLPRRESAVRVQEAKEFDLGAVEATPQVAGRDS